jgi:molybdenum cofactor biosynthesis protein MoaC/molybdopterin-guanine dinucleotide biosynthesis protein MobB
LNAEALAAVEKGTVAKGDVLGLARVAAIMAMKRTAELIPLCHPLSLENCAAEFEIDRPSRRIRLTCTVKLSGRTGAEMEALTGVSVGLLTIYDMCKALDKTMEIGGVRLLEKTGGRSGHFIARKPGPAFLAVSGVKNSGKTTLIEKLIPRLAEKGFRCGVIKHDGHDFSPDVPGTDTHRLLAAGAEGAGIFSSTKSMLVRRGGDAEETALARHFEDLDLIFLEGFKHSGHPKIEVVRGAVSSAPVCAPETLLALATDLPLHLEGVLVCRPDDIEKLGQLVETHIRKKREDG